MSKYNSIQNLPIPEITYDRAECQNLYYFEITNWHESECLQEELIKLKCIHLGDKLIIPLDFVKIPFTCNGKELISSYPYNIFYGINKVGWLKLGRAAGSSISTKFKMEYNLVKLQFDDYFELSDECRGINLMKKYLI